MAVAVHDNRVHKLKIKRRTKMARVAEERPGERKQWTQFDDVTQRGES